MEKIKIQIKMLKNTKSSGEDDIQMKILEEWEKEMSIWLWKLICKVWTTEKIPEKWKTTMICSIHKKGNKHDYNMK